MENPNSQHGHRQPMEQTRDLFCMCSLSITTPVSLFSNEFLKVVLIIANSADPDEMQHLCLHCLPKFSV